MNHRIQPPKGYRVVPCDGSAHDSAFNDNCHRCAPLWGRLVVPEAFPDAESYRDHFWALEESQPAAAKALRRRVRAATTRHANAQHRAYVEWAGDPSRGD